MLHIGVPFALRGSRDTIEWKRILYTRIALEETSSPRRDKCSNRGDGSAAQNDEHPLPRVLRSIYGMLLERRKDLRQLKAGMKKLVFSSKCETSSLQHLRFQSRNSSTGQERHNRFTREKERARYVEIWGIDYGKSFGLSANLPNHLPYLLSLFRISCFRSSLLTILSIFKV